MTSILRNVKYSILISSFLFATFFIYCDHHETPIQVIEHFNCINQHMDTLSSVDTLSCPDEFNSFESTPLQQTCGQVASIKVVYDIATKHLYYVSSKKFELHFDFCQTVLKYPKTHSDFNNDQYFTNASRLYYLGSINHYTVQDIYTLEFFADDKLSAEGIETVYNDICETSYIGNKLYFSPTSTSLEELIIPIKQKIQIIQQDAIYQGQQYQALNNGECYGYIRKIDISDLVSSYLGRHDIVLTNGIPNDISAISGIVTTVFQVPLSHINVLSHNRGTPNMALKDAWTNPLFLSNSDKLVHLTVRADTFVIGPATLDEAENFWLKNEPSRPVTLECNDSTPGLFDMQNISHKSISVVGAKAANLGELTKIQTSDSSPFPIPEGAFAIPFYYYRDHLKRNGLDTVLENLLDDSLSAIDIGRRKTLLENFRAKIIAAPIDPAFVKAVEVKFRSLTQQYNTIRFRSSTNAEDLEGFNGAGLYESYAAELDNPNKSIGEAIKKVYASMWTLEGFEERDYFKINQRTAAMGILVHRSFPEEQANGVAITRNIYNALIPAFTINCQIGETSVVNPPQGTIADQLLFYVMSNTAFTEPAVEYLSYSNINATKPVLTLDELTRLSKYLSMIHTHFYYSVFGNFSVSYYEFAMDVEFKIDGPQRKIYIKQARPY